MLRPRPVPLPVSFVVKKGSNTRARTPGDIPVPVSVTVISTQRTGSIPSCAPGSPRLMEMLNVPPFGIASRALTARLMRAASNWA